nr:hypothetical protein [Actinomycetota bacterium]
MEALPPAAPADLGVKVTGPQHAHQDREVITERVAAHPNPSMRVLLTLTRWTPKSTRVGSTRRVPDALQQTVTLEEPERPNQISQGNPEAHTTLVH